MGPNLHVLRQLVHSQIADGRLQWTVPSVRCLGPRRLKGRSLYLASKSNYGTKYGNCGDFVLDVCCFVNVLLLKILYSLAFSNQLSLLYQVALRIYWWPRLPWTWPYRAHASNPRWLPQIPKPTDSYHLLYLQLLHLVRSASDGEDKGRSLQFYELLAYCFIPP